MALAESYRSTVEDYFVADYIRTFDDFVRHIRGQGFPMTERLLEAAHERATEHATNNAKTRGHRSVNFAPLAKTALARALLKYGY